MKKIGNGSLVLGVIIVNYNAGDLLADCVQAVLASPIDLEVFVSDNGSRDGSLTRLRRHQGGDPRLTILEHGSNLGFAQGNNLVLAHTRAPYLLILNPDCIVGPDSLGQLLDFMDATPDAGMAGCMIRNPDGSEQRSARRRIPTPRIGLTRFLYLGRFFPQLTRNERLDLIDDPVPEGPVPVEAVSGALMLVRRSALEEVGPLDEGYFLHCEDLDWFMRFRRAGWKLYLVPNVAVVHHQGSCSTGRPIAVEWHKHKGMVRFFRKFQLRDYPLPFGVLVVIGIWAHFGLFLAVYGLRRLAGRGRKR
ncbi:glycosyltransferase family 2 protein [Candidatus Thiosymbion oneisti]|uniref:glycosyltransferase family 2 protein n=1 Tax=Candidatus Thiosymbion oneisti TaxID=589554 RepID=UPI000B802EA8|nr:glycosyltransferase family 2 protein [Candidatus Thiosymbion oneisti]